METSQLLPALHDIQVTATLPHEMAQSQAELIKWCTTKLVIVRAEAKEFSPPTAEDIVWAKEKIKELKKS